MTNLQFVRLINPVCSCGYYIGEHQHEIEFALAEKAKYNPEYSKFLNDTHVSDILNELGIMRLCCRSTVICSPVTRFLKTADPFNIYGDETISIKSERIIVNNPEGLTI